MSEPKWSDYLTPQQLAAIDQLHANARDLLENAEREGTYRYHDQYRCSGCGGRFTKEEAFAPPTALGPPVIELHHLCRRTGLRYLRIERSRMDFVVEVAYETRDDG